uniref:Uncharacterized protein n=1 Tax=Zea mays TaxID=4577 RepID=A0A804LUE4_MAIZE
MSSSDPDDAPDGGEDSPLFRRSGGPSSGGTVGDVPVSQSLIKAASNVCFSLFVLAVLVVTVVAVTYQPPDPWLQSSAAITTSLSRVLPNSTFLVPDDSLLPTGEDFNSSTAVPAPVRDEDDAAAAVSAASAAAAGNRTCDPDSRRGGGGGGSASRVRFAAGGVRVVGEEFGSGWRAGVAAAGVRRAVRAGGGSLQMCLNSCRDEE